MANQRRHVETQRSATERVQILAVGRPFPGNAGFQRISRHGFDPYEVADERIAIFRLAWCQRQTTIAEDDGGYTMFVRGGAQRVPPDLSVEMSVKVDNAWRQRKTVDVQYARGRLVDSSDCDDPSVANRQIRNKRGHPGAIVNPSVF